MLNTTATLTETSPVTTAKVGLRPRGPLQVFEVRVPLARFSNVYRTELVTADEPHRARRVVEKAAGMFGQTRGFSAGRRVW